VIALYKDQAIILLTQGAQGSTVYHQDQVIPISPLQVNVVDTTGAGDTFNASFLHAYQKGWPLKACAEFATAAASRAIMTLGARSGIASESEILEFQNHYTK
jgi:sugar/nucleoside kinase (ribokinase family)